MSFNLEDVLYDSPPAWQTFKAVIIMTAASVIRVVRMSFNLEVARRDPLTAWRSLKTVIMTAWRCHAVSRTLEDATTLRDQAARLSQLHETSLAVS